MERTASVGSISDTCPELVCATIAAVPPIDSMLRGSLGVCKRR